LGKCTDANEVSFLVFLYLVSLSFVRVSPFDRYLPKTFTVVAKFGTHVPKLIHNRYLLFLKTLKFAPKPLNNEESHH